MNEWKKVINTELIDSEHDFGLNCWVSGDFLKRFEIGFERILSISRRLFDRGRAQKEF